MAVHLEERIGSNGERSAGHFVPQQLGAGPRPAISFRGRDDVSLDSSRQRGLEGVCVAAIASRAERDPRDAPGALAILHDRDFRDGRSACGDGLLEARQPSPRLPRERFAALGRLDTVTARREVSEHRVGSPPGGVQTRSKAVGALRRRERQLAEEPGIESSQPRHRLEKKIPLRPPREFEVHVRPVAAGAVLVGTEAAMRGRRKQLDDAPSPESRAPLGDFDFDLLARQASRYETRSVRRSRDSFSRGRELFDRHAAGVSRSTQGA